MTSIIFYTTDDCHLCELAETLIVQALGGTEIAVEVVDIASSADLVQQYGTTIPVLSKGEQQLCWPFNAEQVASFLK